MLLNVLPCSNFTLRCLGAEKVDNLFGDADDISSSDEDAGKKGCVKCECSRSIHFLYCYLIQFLFHFFSISCKGFNYVVTKNVCHMTDTTGKERDYIIEDRPKWLTFCAALQPKIFKHCYKMPRFLYSIDREPFSIKVTNGNLLHVHVQRSLVFKLLEFKK